MRDHASPPNYSEFAALRIPYVAEFTFGRMMAAIGAQFVSVAVGWDLYERTGDPWSLGLVGLAQVAPALILTLPAGTLADRFPRRNISMAAHAVMGLGALGLAVVSTLDAPIELTYALLVFAAVGRAFSMPATNSLLAAIARGTQVAYVYAWLTSSSQLATIAGPAIGGLLIAVTGGATASYLAAGAGQLLFVAMVTRLPSGAPPTTSAIQRPRDALAGIGFIWRNPVFLAAITLDLFAVLLGGVIGVLPVFAKDILEVGPAGLGVLRSGPALGALVSALVVTRLPPWERPGRVLLVVVACFGASTIGFGLSRHMLLSFVCLLILGASDSISVVIRGTIQQVLTPDHLRGRVSAMNALFIGLSNELGAFRAGSMAAFVGVVTSVVAGGVGTLFMVVIAAVIWRQLAHVGPLHTLRPPQSEADRPAHAAASAARS